MRANKITLFLLFVSLNLAAQVSDFESIDFTRADNTASLHEGETLFNLPLLAHKLTNDLETDVEKFRAIYTWVCHNVKGDYAIDSEVTHQREELADDPEAFLKWNKAYKRIVYKNLLERKRTMCTGYSYIIKELCQLANIECVIVNGYGRTVSVNIESLEMVNHSWNAVKLNNKWYLCDATWSSGYFDDKNKFVPDYNEGYFLAAPELFAKNHYPEDLQWALTDAIDDKEFVTSPLVYCEMYKYGINPIRPNVLNLTVKRNESVKFTYETFMDLTNRSVELIHYVGNKEKKFRLDNVKKSGDFISFNHKFDSRGVYDVHLKVDNDIVVSYTIKVKK